MPTTPYWKLSGFYFFYFASIGAFVPYWGLYLRDQGFNPAQIGELMAIIMATKIIAPNVWGWLADTTGRRTWVIRVAALLALVCFSGVTLYSGYWWMAVMMALFSFFWNAALPQFEALTMNRLGSRTNRYARIRLWGSIGFIASVALLGPLFERVEVSVLPWIVLVLLAAMWLTTLVVSDGPPGVQARSTSSLLATLRRPEVLALILACFLMQASHGPYYAFFTIYLEDNGYSRTMAGQLWALGVLAEVGVFLMMHRWLPRFGAWPLLMVAIGVTAVRWWLLASLPQLLPVMLLTQVMHAASYGLYHAAAISLIHEFFPGRLQGRGQALYSSLSFGLGGALGSLASGYVWDGIGPHWVYIMASGLAALGFMVAWLGARQSRLSASA
ncbi:major facilitator superfamily MFS_1 [Thioalkalivibrio sulfidiphilus HL-EbGr7]|uniref:Major facilitator superfamily MFS_1 n=1 Tax=Thioalkalivibrio sulfidiphilus (strain HL-EbGR7) TaxID=396588 RepID=B8GQD4_THISH|nr:MFS transporter [Thioalkalivibrio sulfidiphilus]ACL72329.1 major facilitator superfamily MFS_1 [Thioalkalivibrio sulfidiphilus HL-EbGr7]